MAKKHKHEEHENHERWLVSYADFMTLLFAFFVVMYSVSKVDTKKVTQVAQSVKFAMHFQGSGGVGAMPIFEGPPSEGGCVTNTGARPRTTMERKKIAEDVQKKLEKRLKPYLQAKSTAESVKLQMDNGRLAVRLAASHFFDPSQAALRPEALPVLDAIADELSSTGYPLRVEGHTDGTAVRSARFRNNWELSSARAVTVVSYLEAVHRFPGARLSAVGFGDTRPLGGPGAPASSEENRRIELVLELPTEASRTVPVR